uniref:Uncharacterized protein n=1 Tax=viral metagenome TaxID=1070528 RepID=A0A6C0K2W2_9ZZZZ
MPSSLNLFIRIPKGFSEQDVFDAIVRKDICKVIGIVIKKGKSNNNAIVMIDYWYRGTRHIRDALMRGEPISIPNPGPYNWLAFEFKPKTPTESTKLHPYPEYGVDEFGRNIPRKIKPSLNVNAPIFVPIAPTLSEMLSPYVTDNRAERARNQYHNEYAADAFIEKYESYTTPEKTYQNAIAPGAPMKSTCIQSEIEEGELCEIVQKLDTMFINQQNSTASDTKSDISECEYDTTAREKKHAYAPVDFDKPNTHTFTVDYGNAPMIKKRNIRTIKPTK